MSCLVGMAIVLCLVGPAEVLEAKDQQSKHNRPNPIRAIAQDLFDATLHKTYAALRTNGQAFAWPFDPLMTFGYSARSPSPPPSGVTSLSPPA